MGKRTEVVTKVTSVKRSVAGIAASIDYLSREGELELETQSGSLVEGKEANKELVESWTRGHPPIEKDATNARQAYALVLSMPAGTPMEGVREAARGFARREFENHRHVSVLHEDTDHVHVHMLVRAAGHHGNRLNLKKNDFRRWRETFAEELRERGIEANATSRAVRGVVLPREKDAVYRMGVDAARGIERRTPSRVISDRIERMDAMVRRDAGVSDSYPSREALLATRREVEARYERIATLHDDETPQGRAEANRVREFVAGFEPIQRTREHQRLRTQLHRMPDRGEAMMNAARKGNGSEADLDKLEEQRAEQAQRPDTTRAVRTPVERNPEQDGPELGR